MALSRTARLRAAPSVGVPEGLRRTLVLSWPSVIAAVTAVVLLVAMAWNAGGYFPSTYARAGAVALAVLGALLIVRPPHYTLSTQALVALGALAGLAAWTGLSARWSTAPDTALEDMQRTLAYAGLFGLGLIAAGSGRLARHVVWLILAVVLAIVGGGLISRLYPDLIPSSPEGLAGYRLGYPLDYWNTLGALAALGGVLATGLAADPRARVALRALAAAAAVPLLTAMYLSLSRGAWLALAVGVIALIALAAQRGSLLLTLVIVGGGVALAILALRGYPALVDDPTEEKGQLVAGRSYGLVLAAITLACGLAQAVIAAGRASRELMTAGRQVFRPLLVGAAALLLLAGMAIYVVKSSAVESESAGRVESVKRFADRQWDDFMRPGSFGTTGTARLTSARGSRSDLYRVAIDGFEAHPLKGDGAGAFEYRYLRDRGVDEKVRDAHSLYLETFGELGIVGGLLLLTFVGSIAVAAVRSRLRPMSMSRSQSAAVGAACTVWAAHAGVDWDWQMPALTGTVLVLAATLFPHGRRTRSRRTVSELDDGTSGRSGPLVAADPAS